MSTDQLSPTPSEIGYAVLASGNVALVDTSGDVTSIVSAFDWAYSPEDDFEGPSCSICDGLGHGYPGGGPCPLEDRGWEDAERDARYERSMGIPDFGDELRAAERAVA